MIQTSVTVEMAKISRIGPPSKLNRLRNQLRLYILVVLEDGLALHVGPKLFYTSCKIHADPIYWIVPRPLYFSHLISCKNEYYRRKFLEIRTFSAEMGKFIRHLRQIYFGEELFDDVMFVGHRLAYRLFNLSKVNLFVALGQWLSHSRRAHACRAKLLRLWIRILPGAGLYFVSSLPYQPCVLDSGPWRRCNTSDIPIKICLAMQLEAKQA